jgi:hypothetical protein
MVRVKQHRNKEFHVDLARIHSFNNSYTYIEENGKDKLYKKTSYLAQS